MRRLSLKLKNDYLNLTLVHFYSTQPGLFSFFFSFLGTGTFGRVVLAQNRRTCEYGALKILALADIIRLKQVEHVKNEKNILKQINHPFIVNM
jgi:protein kinase X